MESGVCDTEFDSPKIPRRLPAPDHSVPIREFLSKVARQKAAQAMTAMRRSMSAGQMFLDGRQRHFAPEAKAPSLRALGVVGADRRGNHGTLIVVR
jgi:hypothetical protein